MANRQKTKGDNYEREVAAYMNDSLPIKGIARAPLSGGGYIHHDLGGADLINTPGLFVEAKRYEKPRLLEAYKQAERNKAKTGSSESILVVTRASRVPTGDSFCMVKFDDFLKFYSAWLTLNGYAAAPPCGARTATEDQIDFIDTPICFNTDPLM